ncbi:MAG: Coenzyme F420 hydrogenase/dehydrogenase, beta subunit C-terminal domain [Oscillospiraceae bacterium]|nr:Coenzyme F420 hydrogenase/dehydrogenase, beta subunit C-terminal domain [Oscillospiraceae bacterium]
MIIKILLFGQFGGDHSRVVRNFGRAELLSYDAPLSSFVNSSFKALAEEADVAIHGGEPKYKPYIAAAKKCGCMLALWGCETDWISRGHAVLPLFELIFAHDKAAFTALRMAGYENVVLPKDAPSPAEPAEPAEPLEAIAPEPAPEPSPEPELEPEPEPEPVPDEPQAPEPEPRREPIAEPKAETETEPLLTPESLPTLDLPDLEPIPELAKPTTFRFSSGIHAYGVVNRNENVRAVSSAGGVFTLLCEEIIGRGGVVFGARYDEYFQTIQAKADRMPECTPMRGVKYAFGETEGIYAQAVSCLHQGKHVLFTGTPCQIDRLYAHLPAGKPGHPLLLTVGMVCGGTVSQSVFIAYLKYIETKIRARATAVEMSGKPIGSGKPVARIGSENGTYESSVNRDPFLRGYRAGLFLREECYNCPYRGERRGSDLTLCGFSGGRKHIPDLDDNRGASLVLAHTQKGRDMMDALAKRAIVREVPPDALAEYNPAIASVPVKHKNHGRFSADVQNLRFDKAVARSIGPAIWGILTAERSILPLWLKLTKRLRGSRPEREQD